jgi:beta-lactam-binding protein with PASTA domain
MVMPSLVGMGLQDAQDELQAMGIYSLDQEDASGEGRVQLVDSNWKVCSQSPQSGAEVSTDTAVTLSSVKLSETCPGAAGGGTASSKAPSTQQAAQTFAMPNVTGMVLQDAQDLLQSFGSYLMNQEDASGQGRTQLLDSNWQVCMQDPASGVRVSVSDLVTLWSVRLDEICP